MGANVRRDQFSPLIAMLSFGGMTHNGDCFFTIFGHVYLVDEVDILVSNG